MKIIINETNKPDDVPLRVAIRLINKGKAHSLAQSVIVPQDVILGIPLYNDQVLNKTQIEKLKEFKEKVIEVDVIEPIPERFISFDEPKEVKTIKKVKNNK